ncbi:hypothetical protein [Nocardioides sp. LHG3406-4]|uniref:hypothetical protein n=1 Tax=Nocardioides sp. LHG3406-4 TaxID=2804575 RepID=UPI003CF745CE
MIQRSCVACEREPAASGLLFCALCTPPSQLQQSVTIRMTKPNQGITDVRAKVRPDPTRRPVREAKSVEAWNHDRQRLELKTIYTDRDRDLFVEVWQDPETGEIAWAKREKLSDQDHHGERTKAAQRNQTGGSDSAG